MCVKGVGGAAVQQRAGSAILAGLRGGSVAGGGAVCDVQVGRHRDLLPVAQVHKAPHGTLALLQWQIMTSQMSHIWCSKVVQGLALQLTLS